MTHAAAHTDDELAVIEPPEARVTIAGVDLAVTPLTIGQLPAITRLMRPVLADMQQTLERLLSGDLNAGLALIDSHGEAILQAVAVATRRDLDWVEALPVDQALRLIGAVVEVNSDFFQRAVLPVLASLGRSTEAAMGAETAGPTSSTP